MRRLSRLSLRARLAIALVSVAALTVAIATVLANRGLDPLVTDAALARVQRSAEHMAEIAAAVYEEENGWSPQARETLGHLAELDGLRFSVRGDGVRFGAELAGTASARSPVVLDGREIATIEVAQVGDGLLTPEEEHLQHSLDRLHLAAGAVSVIVALVLAFSLAETLSRRLRRIRLTADRIGRGELDARVEPGGDPEIRSVGLALNRLAETLEREEEIRKQTVADLAHELRTPVNGLLSRIEAAQDGVITGPENLAAMHDEVLRLIRLLEDLSRLTDAEQPGLLLVKDAVDLAAVASGSTASFAPRFADAGIALTLEVESAWIDGNADRLGQVIANLLSNALQHTSRGGVVNVLVGRVGRCVILEIADTGRGIASDDLQHVFTRFWRGDRSRSPATGGTGIGLAIVSELVRAHDGTVDVDIVLGEGATFRITFPGVDPPSTRMSSDADFEAARI